MPPAAVRLPEVAERRIPVALDERGRGVDEGDELAGVPVLVDLLARPGSGLRGGGAVDGSRTGRSEQERGDNDAAYRPIT